MSEHAAEPKTAHPEHKAITIEVNNQPYVPPESEMTGAEIKQLAGIPLDFQLYLLHGDSQRLDPISDEQPVKLHEHERFRAVSGQDVS